MRVDWAIISRYAETTGTTATIVGAGIDTYYPPDLPAEIVVPLTVQLRAHQNEMGRPHEVSLRILDADLDQVGEEGKLGFEATANPYIEQGWEAGVLFTIVSHFVASADGTYSIEISVDGEHKKSIPFRIVPGGQPPP